MTSKIDYPILDSRNKIGEQTMPFQVVMQSTEKISGTCLSFTEFTNGNSRSRSYTNLFVSWYSLSADLN